LTYVLQENVSKVLLGASALMSDGSVLGRVGTACVALAAHKHNIPVLVCCETYKISNRVQLESITHNELGNPEALLNEDDVLQNWKEIDGLKLLNVLYDLTPAAFVSGIVTELGIVPPTSVAVLLREMDQGS
jgi:translation initiation factor eIF-2B subunit delta